MSVSPILLMRVSDTDEITCPKSHNCAELGFEPNYIITVLCCLLLVYLNYLTVSLRGFWSGIPFLCYESGGILLTHLFVTNVSLSAILLSSTRPCPLQPRKRKVIVEKLRKTTQKVKTWFLSFQGLRSWRVAERIFQSNFACIVFISWTSDSSP